MAAVTLTLGKQEYFSGTNTFTFPSGVYWVWATGVAGGGGGGSAPGVPVNDGGGGGGSGETVQNYIIYGAPGSTMTCTVGAGGGKGTPARATNCGDIVGGNNPLFGGNGGSDTVIGPIRLAGGYGGFPGFNGGTGGMGGGWAATRQSNGLGDGGSNAGFAGSPGFRAVKKNSCKWFSGSGGGSYLVNQGKSNVGGPFAPFLGGTATPAGGSGGAGGAASLFGPGGNGGAFNGNAPATPAGSYGAGGGGAGTNSTVNTGITTVAFSGADGVGGYILLTWIAKT